MKRIVVSALGVAGVAVLGTAGFRATRPPQTVYSVDAVRAGLSRAPRAWAGHVVLVRAVAAGCAYGALCRFATAELVNPGATSHAGGIPLQWGPQDPLLAWLRHLPVVGTLAPRAQLARWGTSAVYRVRLQAGPGAVTRSTCSIDGCYQAVLLDAAPAGIASYPPAHGPAPIVISVPMQAKPLPIATVPNTQP